MAILSSKGGDPILFGGRGSDWARRPHRAKCRLQAWWSLLCGGSGASSWCVCVCVWGVVPPETRPHSHGRKSDTARFRTLLTQQLQERGRGPGSFPKKAQSYLPAFADREPNTTKLKAAEQSLTKIHVGKSVSDKTVQDGSYRVYN